MVVGFKPIISHKVVNLGGNEKVWPGGDEAVLWQSRE